MVKVLLFDGESGLNTQTARKIAADTYGIKLHAEAGFKRNLAERAVREIKLRTAIQLDLNGKQFCIYLIKNMCAK